MSAMSEQIRNWAGNVLFSPARSHHPASLDEVRQTVAAARSARVLGTGHSFNRIADTDGDLLVLDAMPAEVRIDPDAGTATVPAGMRLADLAAQLHAAGFALTALPSLPHISLAGACATGTHGSGNANQGLAALVRGMQLVGPDGDVVELKRGESADFDGAVVALGALGVVTELTVDVVPTFDVAQFVYEGVAVPQLIAGFDEVFSAGYSVSAFTEWRGEASVWVKAALAPGASEASHPEPGWLGGHLAEHAAHPIPGMSAENCTEQLGVPGPWHERLPHFRPGFTPSSGEELQSEFFLARSRAAEALDAVRELGPLIAPVVQISEVRTVAADALWLSPAYQRDSVTIHFTWVADRAAVEPALAAVEAALLPLGARPHWGKVFLSGPAAALAGYERADDFRKLLARRDPEGKFRNEFVRRLFPAG
ncbi:FAD linked oxidase domain protein [Catenulispora acidiphila DSM 44928]|uniref:FAD linked oxidase domain protein n=1 Tax=Catenulispora acidiphila (strain DSM 44928 / JCM 14897 / NBRC 102108 / NRRL B-24433 / ID139908) TaxID=479433 RepID=C7QEK6_CATAD|nr:FAD-binding protein [Catenulispora acidiphila]ACU70897.1 FAD linked oxidase domain protein [Catenulispora acidiphila DSM 44928]